MHEIGDILPLARALREWLPPGRTGAPTNPATAWRWATRGARTRGGGRAYLRLTRIGGRLYLERAAVEDFKAACSGEPSPAPVAAVPSPTPATGQTAAVEVLARAGILPDPSQAAADRPRDRRRARRGGRCG